MCVCECVCVCGSHLCLHCQPVLVQEDIRVEFFHRKGVRVRDDIIDSTMFILIITMILTMTVIMIIIVILL